MSICMSMYLSFVIYLGKKLLKSITSCKKSYDCSLGQFFNLKVEEVCFMRYFFIKQTTNTGNACKQFSFLDPFHLIDHYFTQTGYSRPGHSFLKEFLLYIVFVSVKPTY